jgi:hypothetical protein
MATLKGLSHREAPSGMPGPSPVAVPGDKRPPLVLSFFFGFFGYGSGWPSVVL